MFLLWLLFIFVVAYLLLKRELAEFDPHRQLDSVNANDMVAHLQSALNDTSPLANALVHISDKDCHCNRYTSKHLNELNTRAESGAFNIKYLSVDNLQPDTLVPSTPAVALIGENNRLIYFGPYAFGIACSEKNSLIELSWDNYQKGFNSELILNDAQGCYCNRKP